MISKDWIKMWNGKKGKDFKTIFERNNIAVDMVKGNTIILDVGCGD